MSVEETNLKPWVEHPTLPKEDMMVRGKAAGIVAAMYHLTI